MLVEINKKELKKFLDFVKNSYPNECCGFLIGTETKAKTTVDYIYIPEDQEKQSTEDYINITQDWWDEAVELAENHDFKLLGFIHSHPDYKETSMSEGDLALTDLFKQELDVFEPIMGIVAVWKVGKKRKYLKTKVGLWPMFNKHDIKVV